MFDVFRLCLGCVRPSVFGLCLTSFELNTVFRCLGDTKVRSVSQHAGVGAKQLCAAADPTALWASPATVPN